MKIRIAIIIVFVAATMAAQMADAKKKPENKVEVGTASTSGWICTLSPFTNEYKATGGSKDEAKERAIKDCKEKENPMFCKEPECTKG